MARPSYFSQMVRGGAVGALTPPRPVSNLWKSARLDWMASEGAADTVARPPVFGRQAVSLVRTDRAATPVAASAPELLPLLPPSGERRAKTSPTPMPVAVEPAAVPRRTTREAAEPTIPAKRISSAEPHSDIRSDHLNRSAEALAVAPATQPEPTMTSVAQAIELRPEAHHIREQLAPRPAHIDSEEQTIKARTRPLLQLEPQRRRENPRSEWPVPTPAKARSNEKNTIQIGRIEVQVVSPPAAVRVAAQAPPKARLARGYTLWSTL